MANVTTNCPISPVIRIYNQPIYCMYTFTVTYVTLRPRLSRDDLPPVVVD